MASTEKKPDLSKRSVACFVLSLLQTTCGIGLLGVGAADISLKPYETSHDKTGLSFLQGLVCLVSGCFAATAYLPRHVRANGGRPSPVLVAVHVVLSVLAAMVSFNTVSSCSAEKERKDGMSRSSAEFALLLSKFILTYTCHILGGICAGMASPDICNQGVPAVSYTPPPPATPKQQVPLQLPEARTHIQEAPGTGEKLTVVTLPEAEGVVYAVPEQCYVVRKPEGSYVAPAGNVRLTPFFPTYTKVQVE